MGWRLWAVVPVLLLALAVGFVVTSGSSLVDLVGTNPPPADEFDIRRVEFSPGEIRITVRNPQPDDLTIANVNVDDAIVPYTVDGPTTLGRLRSSTIVVPFDWVEEDPITVGVTSSTGIQTVHEIPAAIETPEPSVEGFLGYALIGVLVGVLPVALGLLWLPALRQASAAWLSAFMALTAGLLTFLGVEALTEAFELQALLPSALGGSGLVLLGVALSFLGMTALSGRLSGGGTATGLALALLVAIGIGVHNLGEGLAIGASFALGELQLGDVPDHRLHDPQRHRGARHRRPRREDAGDRSRARGARARRRCADDPRRVDRRLHDRATSSASSSSRSPPARPSRSSSRWGATSRARRRAAFAPGTRSAASSRGSPRCTSPASSSPEDPRNRRVLNPL